MGPAGPPRHGRAQWAVAAGLFGLGLALMFRHHLADGGARALNDDGDGGIVLAILEHWSGVFTGRVADWRTPPWFWPAPHPLSLTDTLFLLSLPYAAARALGADWFGALDLTLGLVAVIGFWSFVALARRGGVSPAIAGVFSFVFTFGVVPQFKLFHAQTFTMQFAPVLALMLLAAFDGSRRAAPGWAAAAGLLVGAMFFTAAQTPWFLALEVGLAGLLALLFNLRSLGTLTRATTSRAAAVAACFAVGAIVGLIPFVLHYRQSAGFQRDWMDVLVFSAYPLDLFNIPTGNLLWSGLLERLHIAGQPGRNEQEVALGWTPILAGGAALGFLLFGRIRRAAGPGPWDRAVRPLLAAAALGPVISVHFRWFDLWHLVYRFVPGGRSIRTPFRIELAAHLLLCLGLALLAGRLWVVIARGGWWPRLAATGVLALLVAEQVGAGPITRDAATMRRWMTVARPPPAPCQAFYLVPSDGLFWQDYQSDAMLLAEITATPTVNGNASFYPAGWDLRYPGRPAYAAQALGWIDAHVSRDRVCGIEPRTGRWIAGVEPLTDAAARAP